MCNVYGLTTWKIIRLGGINMGVVWPLANGDQTQPVSTSINHHPWDDPPGCEYWELRAIPVADSRDIWREAP